MELFSRFADKTETQAPMWTSLAATEREELHRYIGSGPEMNSNPNGGIPVQDGVVWLIQQAQWVGVRLLRTSTGAVALLYQYQNQQVAQGTSVQCRASLQYESGHPQLG